MIYIYMNHDILRPLNYKLDGMGMWMQNKVLQLF